MGTEVADYVGVNGASPHYRYTSTHEGGAHHHTSRSFIMPAKSKSQQQAAGVALAAKEGEKKVSELKGPSKSMYKSMSEKELHNMASTKTKHKPDHKSDKK